MLRFGPRDGPVVIAAPALFEEANRTRAFLVRILRLLGDCGIAQRWVWNGRGFALAEQSEMRDCAGVPADLWPTLWRSL